MAWKFLSFIYKSKWNKLIANKNNKTFKQCISSQFNMKPTKNIVNNNLSKDKQTNISRISRISLLISPMSRLKKVDLIYFIFLFIFYFILYLFYIFYF